MLTTAKLFARATVLYRAIAIGGETSRRDDPAMIRNPPIDVYAQSPGSRKCLGRPRIFSREIMVSRSVVAIRPAWMSASGKW